MAVNVNEVYTTVLTVLNKEQRGYLTPDEFNDLARQVQTEIFESYFLKMAQSPEIMDEFSDPMKNITEKINVFHSEATLSENDDSASIFDYPADFYRLGVVMTDSNIIIDQVGHMDIAYINLSNFTAPTETQPVYVRRSGGIQVYPNDDANAVTDIILTYLRRPSDPVWGFNQTEFDDSGDVVYDPDTSTNFELHPSEQHELVIRILNYAGVVVRDPNVSGFAGQVEQKLAATEE